MMSQLSDNQICIVYVTVLYEPDIYKYVKDLCRFEIV